MSEPTASAQGPTLETPPPVLNPEPKTVIHGLDKIVGPAGAAIGAADDTATGDVTPSDQAGGQQPQTAPTDTAVPVNERIKQDPELQTYIEKTVQSSVSRAVNDARNKWDTETLQKKLQLDRQSRDEALRELALKAQQGGEEGAVALQELGKTVQAQVLRQQSASEFAQAWFTEADMAVAKQMGADLSAHEQLRVNNFGSIAEWVDAIVKAKTQTAVATERDSFQKEIEKLAEAKAADLVAARRQNLPVPDTSEPVQGGGGTVRKWKSLAEAAALFSNDEISTAEYAKARQWYEEGRIPPGVYMGEF